MLVDDLQYQTPLGKSDHVCLVWNYIISVEEHETQQRKFYYWKGDYNKLTQIWKVTTGKKKSETILPMMHGTSLKEYYKRQSTGIFHYWASEKKFRNPWLTKATKRHISKRNKAWRRYNELKTERNYSTYKKLRNKANKRIKIDQSAYRKKILGSFKETINFFMVI